MEVAVIYRIQQFSVMCAELPVWLPGYETSDSQQEKNCGCYKKMMLLQSHGRH